MAKSNAVRVGAIENNGPNTLVSYLRNAGRVAAQIDIAVAFITNAGLGSVFHVLKRTSARGQVHLLTGLYQGFTEPRALRSLLREQQTSDGRFLVRLSDDPHFHWKAYFLMGKTTANVIVGSSNLTDDGLRQTGEFNAVLSMWKVSKQFHKLHGIFDKHWQAKSCPLTDEVLGNYEDWRESVEIAVQNHNVPVGKILAFNRRKLAAETERAPSFWRTCIDGYLSDEAMAFLKETTDWDRRGYLYFSTGRTGYNRGDQVVLFNVSEHNVMVVEVKDTTECPPGNRTPDGSHFAAYRRVRGTRLRRLLPKRWKSLKAAGLIRRRNDVHMTRKLSATNFETIVANLKQIVQ
jgi:HKD family nuclease